MYIITSYCCAIKVLLGCTNIVTFFFYNLLLLSVFRLIIFGREGSQLIAVILLF